MGWITAIEKNKNRIVLDLDGVHFATLSQQEFASFRLSVGDELDEDEFTDRLSALQMPRAYETALSMLTLRDMTQKGMKDALCRKQFLPAVAEAAVERLCENRLIDDARYARRFVELRAEEGHGRLALRQKLKMKGVDDDIIDEALSQIGEDAQREAACALLTRLYPRYQDKPAREAKAKLSQALARRGFSWDVISAATGRFFDAE